MATNSFSLPSFAKINCLLDILGRRPDGYHELFTVFQTISLRDTLHFQHSDDSVVTLHCNVEGVPASDDNLIVKAARALKERFGVKYGANIVLEKVVPLGAGLGGGSSNAAVTLLGLTHLWEIKPSPGDLWQVARSLGADVAFFLTGGTAAGTGIGDRISPLRNLEYPYLIVVLPPVQVSSAEAYSRLNAPALTKDSTDIMLSVSDLEAMVRDFSPDSLRNGFEPAIFRLAPEARRAKEALISFGAKGALMSGSGSGIFGIFDNREAQMLAFHRLQEEAKWRVFLCSTISREDYLSALGPCAAFLQRNL